MAFAVESPAPALPAITATPAVSIAIAFDCSSPGLPPTKVRYVSAEPVALSLATNASEFDVDERAAEDPVKLVDLVRPLCKSCRFRLLPRRWRSRHRFHP